MADSTKQVQTWAMLGPNEEPVAVQVTFERFPNDPVDYWHSATTSDGQIVEPWKDGTFQKGDGTILHMQDIPAFTRKMPQDS